MPKLKMTHNEYQLLLKENANRIYDKNDDYGLKQYTEDADNVEIIGFDLSDYNLPKEIEKYINISFTKERKDRNGAYGLQGFACGEDDLYNTIVKLKLKYKDYGYSGYGYNDDLKLYLTYTEGDLFLILFKTKEEYDSSFTEMVNWYKEEYRY